jgi:hypothetical protein
MPCIVVTRDVRSSAADATQRIHTFESMVDAKAFARETGDPIVRVNVDSTPIPLDQIAEWKYSQDYSED